MKKILFLMIVVAVTFSSCSKDDNGDDAVVAPTPTSTGSFVDARDNTTYHYVRYGNLEWTTENLHYVPSDGATVPDLTPKSPRVYDDGVATYYYPIFGLLYDYAAAEAAIPEGWRLPTDEDWINLANTVGNGVVTKAINLQLGGLDIEAANNAYSILDYTHVFGYYWTSTADKAKGDGTNFAYFRKYTYNNNILVRESMTKANKLSVRLVRDAK
jgi:uncharacterized protein (TIGR02145 family)